MTVKELIEALQALTPEQQETLPVWCMDYTGEITEADELMVEPAEHGYPAMARIRG